MVEALGTGAGTFRLRGASSSSACTRADGPGKGGGERSRKGVRAGAPPRCGGSWAGGAAICWAGGAAG